METTTTLIYIQNGIQIQISGISFQFLRINKPTDILNAFKIRKSKTYNFKH